MITCDAVIGSEETKTVTLNPNATCKTKKLYISLAFWLISVALLIAYKWQIKKWSINKCIINMDSNNETKKNLC